MPISGNDREDMARSLSDNWMLEEGHYLAEIEDVNLVTVSEGKRPLCWDLLLIDDKRKIKKYHWIQKEGGVNILLSDLQGLGVNISRENAVNVCNSLIGSKIEIEVAYNGEYQNITFLRRVY